MDNNPMHELAESIEQINLAQFLRLMTVFGFGMVTGGVAEGLRNPSRSRGQKVFMLVSLAGCAYSSYRNFQVAKEIDAMATDREIEEAVSLSRDSIFS